MSAAEFDDLMLECAIVTSGLRFGAVSPQDPLMAQFRRDAHEWRLLFQAPSVWQAGMEWGDEGCLNYWIREEDLRRCRFDHCWMILQCG